MGALVTDNEILLSGTVGGDGWFDDGFTSGDVVNALAGLGRDTNIVLRINSGGGIATEGAAIHAALAAHKGTVQVIVEGIAASAASLIAMAGDTITMRPGAIMMIHDPAAFTIGDAKAHAKTIQALDALGDAYAGIYADRAGISQEAAREIMREETWYTPEAAVAAGFADALAPENDNTEPTAFAYGVYAKAPPKLVAMASANGWRPRASMAAPVAPIRQQKEFSMTATPQETVNDSAVDETDAAASIHPETQSPDTVAEAAVTNSDNVADITLGDLEHMTHTDALADAFEAAMVAGVPAKIIGNMLRDRADVATVQAKAALAGEFSAIIADARKINPALTADVGEFIASGVSVDTARQSLLDRIVAQQSPEVHPHVSADTQTAPAASSLWDKVIAKRNAR